MIKLINDIYDKLIILIMIILIILGCYFMYDAYYIKYISSGDAFSAYKPTDEEPEKYGKLGSDCIGWITIDDTSIDYPLMQGKDNSKYLNTSPDGKYSLAGSVFLDWQCDPELKEGFGLIYAHHMSDHRMFGALDLYNEETFFKEHLTGAITLKGKKERLDVFAFVITDANEKIIFDPTHYTGQYEWALEHGIWKIEGYNSGRVVALATCKDPGTTERTVLFCTIGEKDSK